MINSIGNTLEIPCGCASEGSICRVYHHPLPHLQNPDKFTTTLTTTSALTAHSKSAIPQNQLWLAANTIKTIAYFSVCRNILVSVLSARGKQKLFLQDIIKFGSLFGLQHILPLLFTISCLYYPVWPHFIWLNITNIFRAVFLEQLLAACDFVHIYSEKRERVCLERKVNIYNTDPECVVSPECRVLKSTHSRSATPNRTAKSPGPSRRSKSPAAGKRHDCTHINSLEIMYYYAFNQR